MLFFLCYLGAPSGGTTSPLLELEKDVITSWGNNMVEGTLCDLWSQVIKMPCIPALLFGEAHFRNPASMLCGSPRDWRDPCWEEQECSATHPAGLLANSQRQLASHVSEPSRKWVLQLPCELPELRPCRAETKYPCSGLPKLQIHKENKLIFVVLSH